MKRTSVRERKILFFTHTYTFYLLTIVPILLYWINHELYIVICIVVHLFIDSFKHLSCLRTPAKAGHFFSSSSDRAILFLWIGTCNFTFKSTKIGYIHLKYNTNNYRPRVDTIVERLQNLKRQIETRYRRSRVILLECPPFSIIQHSKTSGHLTSNTFHKQTVKLEDQITYFNEQIQAINLTAASNITGRYIYKSSYMSPNFTKDIITSTKGSKSRPGKKVAYYINYSLLCDGLHPSGLVSKLWLRRICAKVIQASESIHHLLK